MKNYIVIKQDEYNKLIKGYKGILQKYRDLLSRYELAIVDAEASHEQNIELKHHIDFLRHQLIDQTYEEFERKSHAEELVWCEQMAKKYN